MIVRRDRRAGFKQADGLASSIHLEPDVPATEAARVGAELRAARLRLGIALPDVSAKLRIRLPLLEAVEDGRLADLPGPVYAVGFARAYATLLGLDADGIARRFRPETAERTAGLVFPTSAPKREVPAGVVVLLGLLLAAVSYAGWYKFSGAAQPVAGVVSAVPDHLAALINRAPSSSSPAAPEPSEPATTAPDPSPSLAEPVASPPAAAPAPPSDESRIMLRLSADTWIQVRERQGHVLLNRVMRGGESWEVPKGAPLLLTTGNAGGTELLVDGEATPSLGPSGAVRRDIALEPDSLKAEIVKAGSTARPPSQ